MESVRLWEEEDDVQDRTKWNVTIDDGIARGEEEEE